MASISVREARENFRSLLDRVAAGEEISLIRRGKEVARLSPPKGARRKLPSLDAFRRSMVELRSALSRKVRLGELSTTSATQIASRFFGHLEEGLYTRNPVERRHYEMAGEWLGRFTLTLRTLDALHLAVVTAGGFRLATADATLARSAKALGIETHWLRAKEP